MLSVATLKPLESVVTWETAGSPRGATCAKFRASIRADGWCLLRALSASALTIVPVCNELIPRELEAGLLSKLVGEVETGTRRLALNALAARAEADL